MMVLILACLLVLITTRTAQVTSRPTPPSPRVRLSLLQTLLLFIPVVLVIIFIVVILIISLVTFTLLFLLLSLRLSKEQRYVCPSARLLKNSKRQILTKKIQLGKQDCSDTFPKGDGLTSQSIPLLICLCIWGSAVSSPSRVCSKAQAANAFVCISSSKIASGGAFLVILCIVFWFG